ncbi:MAG TPA: hypothetical protein VGM54_17360 [Chthoniobacter sp.]|jgi:hypothetical protein
MNEFERRWQMGARASRGDAPNLSNEAPLGFATRVVAQWQAHPEPSLMALWQRLSLRVLGVMALIFLALAVYGAFTVSGDNSIEPPVENAVADSFWLL